MMTPIGTTRGDRVRDALADEVRLRKSVALGEDAIATTAGAFERRHSTSA